MSITIETAEIEALLADLADTSRKAAPDLLLDWLRRERQRLAEDRQRDRVATIASGRLLHERTHAGDLVDPRPIDELLAYDENGLPV